MVVETTIRELQSDYVNNITNAEEVVKKYINRIKNYDDRLNSVIAINPAAVEDAKKRDKELSDSGLQGPLHGIPVALKDNISTSDMPTTAGSKAFKDYMSNEDAHLVKNLRSAGAIILCKTNLGDFATGYHSSMNGRTNNPYDTTRTPSGSSAGSGVSVAANLATVGVGTDTGGSVRQPSAYNGLFGMRPTPGLISRSGIIPVSYTQDTAGPMTRTVEDMAILLDGLVGYDHDDERTAENYNHIPQSYQSSLNAEKISNVRIGVLRDSGKFIGCKDLDEKNQSKADKVTEVFFDSMSKIESLGGEITYSVSIDGIWEIATKIDSITKGAEFLDEMQKFINSTNDTLPYNSIDDVVQSGKYINKKGTQKRLNGIAKEIDVELDNPPLEENALYQRYFNKRKKIRNSVIEEIEKNDLDALAFPTFARPPIKHESGNYRSSSNTHVASATDLPEITIPIGFVEINGNELPVAMDLIGPKYSEPKLIEIAYSFEQISRVRVPPAEFETL